MEWFEATGHTLRGSFLDYWQKNGGLAQFGYPITEMFFEPSGHDNSPVLVQYFERNRFEHHPEYVGTKHEVLLGTLGREFHPQDAPAPAMPAPARYFPETGHNLSGSFKAYWETHGGLPIHGYPITEQFEGKNPLNGRTYVVQYFERSRFELHPENAGSPYEVLLGQLGTQLSQERGYPYGWYPPASHAADMSWISGYLELYADYFCAADFCGCSLLRFGMDEQVLQLNTQNGGQYLFHKREFATRKPLVIFGRMARVDEPKYVCPAETQVPIYVVERIQTNPAD
ncbi:MAG: hypothetical protein M3441_15795 [Chloroflexota bacterium]|nr:hypothetical protein [Chloroflexota bacterium]